jgi:hypothetical protein
VFDRAGGVTGRAGSFLLLEVGGDLLERHRLGELADRIDFLLLGRSIVGCRRLMRLLIGVHHARCGDHRGSDWPARDYRGAFEFLLEVLLLRRDNPGDDRVLPDVVRGLGDLMGGRPDRVAYNVRAMAHRLAGGLGTVTHHVTSHLRLTSYRTGHRLRLTSNRSSHGLRLTGHRTGHRLRLTGHRTGHRLRLTGYRTGHRLRLVACCSGHRLRVISGRLDAIAQCAGDRLRAVGQRTTQGLRAFGERARGRLHILPGDLTGTGTVTLTGPRTGTGTGDGILSNRLSLTSQVPPRIERAGGSLGQLVALAERPRRIAE